MMRRFNDEDDHDTDYERNVAFLEVCDSFDEDVLIPKIFGQYEKTYLKTPHKRWLQIRFGLSDYMSNKLFRICQKRKGIGITEEWKDSYYHGTSIDAALDEVA